MATIVETEAIQPLVEAAPAAPRAAWWRRAARQTGRTVDWLFGCLSMIVGLGIVSTVPLAQLLSLGYLLEVSRRAAERRWRELLPGIGEAARAGRIVVGAWLVLLPLRVVATMVANARTIAPGGRADRIWTLVLWTLTALAVMHLIAACARGGRWRHFLWPAPIKTARIMRDAILFRGVYSQTRDATCDFLTSLDWGRYFWLGLRGFVGGFAWLAAPVTLLAAGRETPAIGFLGALLLGIVVLYLPLAEARFAVENRLRALFEIRALRRHFRRAPLAFLAAIWLTLALSLPLYLLKIELVPREAAWLPSLVFVVFMLPARISAGWAYGRSIRRESPRWRLATIPARLAMIPAVATYVGFVYLTQYTSWHGIWSLYEQHAFLLPVPFLGL